MWEYNSNLPGHRRGGEGGRGSSKQQAGVRGGGSTCGPDARILGATLRTAATLGGWVPLRTTLSWGSLWRLKSPAIPVGGHFTAQYGPIGPEAEEWAKIGQNSPRRTQKGAQTPLWIPPTGLNPPLMTNDMPMEHCLIEKKRLAQKFLDMDYFSKTNWVQNVVWCRFIF